jgi:outer membrane protein assembly factor BamC
MRSSDRIRSEYSRTPMWTPTWTHALRISAALLAVCSLAACDTLDNYFAGDKVDYSTASAAPSLAVPPGLSTPTLDKQFTAPPATAALGGVPDRIKTVSGNLTVGVPSQGDPLGMHVEHDAKQSWLVVDGRTPEQLWPQLNDFWTKNGFVLTTDSAPTGVLETDWAENRAKIPDDWFRKSIGRLLDSVYSSGTRDRFRTLVERGPNGTTDIFITHHGMEEVSTGQDKETTRWVDAPRDRNLEIAFTKRLMETFGLTTEQAQQLVAQAPAVDRVQTQADGSASTLILREPFDRAWLHVGVALDRSNYTVASSDKGRGLYTVSYVDLAQETKADGLLSKLFGSKTSRPQPGKQYLVSVKPVDNGAQVAVIDPSGQPDGSSDAKRLVTQLHSQLD